MTRPTTEQLKTSLEELVKTYNEAVTTQQNCKEAIIAGKLGEEPIEQLSNL